MTERGTAIDEWGERPVALAENTGVDIHSVPVERRLATDQPAPPPPTARRSRLGQLMIERGLVSDEELDEALAEQRSTGQRVGETLVARGVLSSVDLAMVLADHLGVPFVDLRSKSTDLVLASLIPEHVARRYNALPVSRWGEQLVVAMANPNDVFAVDDLRVLTGHAVIAALADPQQLQETIDRAFQHARVESTLGDATSDADAELDTRATDEMVSPGLSGVETPMTPDMRTTGTTGISRRKRRGRIFCKPLEI